MKTAAPVHNADIATAAAANLVWDNVARQVGMPIMSASAMSTAIRPAYGVVWNRTIIDKVATKRINDELSRIRNSALPTQEYRRLGAMFLGAYRSANSFPSELWAWRQTAGRPRLDPTFVWGPILELSALLPTKGIWLPVDLGRLPPEQLHVLFEGFPSPQLLRTFGSVKRTLGSYPASADYVAPGHTAFTQELMAKAAKAHSEQSAPTGKIRVRTANMRHLPRSLGRLGPSQKIKALRAPNMAHRVLDRFAVDATKADLLKQARWSFPGMESAFRRYAAFCVLRQTPPFPVAEETVLHWGRRLTIQPPSETMFPSWGSDVSFPACRPPG